MLAEGVTDYAERMGVEIEKNADGRLIIRAYNQGGYDCTEVDLLELICWLKNNMPEWVAEKLADDLNNNRIDFN